MSRRAFSNCHRPGLLETKPLLRPYFRLASAPKHARSSHQCRPLTVIHHPITTRALPEQRRGIARAAFVSTPTDGDLNALQSRVQELSTSVLKPTDGPVPSEQRVLYVIEQIDAIAHSIADANSIASAVSLSNAVVRNGKASSAASALLGSVYSKRKTGAVTKAVLLKTISQRAEDIIRHPNVFITSAILKAYVHLQKLLHQPSSFPAVFELYAFKPAARANSDGSVSYTQSNPESLKTAIDRNTADTALVAAITAHDLVLSLAIIDTSVATPSYGRAKVVRQCAIPGTALALLPALAYGASTQFSAWSAMLDPAQATTIAFAGIMTYAATVGGMGYVALTTANDQMDRVTWAPGVPLWERWVREEERAAFDKIASAWGFKSLEKRGDEEGEDWEILRETCGRRGMELDKVELMEGMQ